jgi:hypothetical protein
MAEEFKMAKEKYAYREAAEHVFTRGAAEVRWACDELCARRKQRIGKRRDENPQKNRPRARFPEHGIMTTLPHGY